MTHQSDIVARLRHGEGQDWDMPYATREEAADHIETQAATIEALRAVIGEVHDLFEDGIAGVDHRGFQKEGEAARYTRVRMKLRAAATAIASGAYRETGSD